MVDDFRWNAWNIDHIAEHGISVDEAEYVVRHAKAPYPSYEGDERWLVRGQTGDGEFIQVAFVIDPDGKTAYVIHARPLERKEKRHLRRRRK